MSLVLSWVLLCISNVWRCCEPSLADGVWVCPVVMLAFEGELPFLCVACSLGALLRNGCNIIPFCVSCTISMTWRRKQVGVCFYILKAVYMIDFFLKCHICKVPSFLLHIFSFNCCIVCSGDIVRWFSGIGVQFQKRIWKIVQGFFPLHDLTAKPSWVSYSDFIQRLSYNVCTEYEWAKRACLNKSSLVQYYGAIYCNFVKIALTFILYLQDWHPSCIEISFPIWCSNRWIFADFTSNFHVSGT